MLLNLLLIIGASLLISLATLSVAAMLFGRTDQTNRLKLSPDDGETAYLFDDELLVDATPEARAILDSTPAIGSDWSRLLSAFIPQFPDLKTKIQTLADEGVLALQSRNGNAELLCEWRNGLARISLRNEGAADTRDYDRHIVQAMEQELMTLRATSDNGPLLVWREHADGTVTWANTAYLALADMFEPGSEIQSWPPRRLFEEFIDTDATSDPASEPKGDAQTDPANARQDMRRICLRHPEGNMLWYDVYHTAHDDGALLTAVPANDAVATETALRAFSSTLSNTFSHLSIGLAVFDRTRRLALYNPALIDLTGLATLALDRKPTLFEFLDKLRDARMMPEPKDYANWRQNVAELEAQAEEGTFEEHWALPSETTYRVSGRPHTDGAIAFFFEDITSEVSLSRRFRSEIDTVQSVLNSLESAIAVFGNDGQMVMSNSSYDSLWGLKDDAPLMEFGILDAARMWHSKCAPTAIWDDIKDVVNGEHVETEWSGVARLWDGRRLSCHISPLPGGQTVAKFVPDAVATAMPRTARLRVDPEAAGM